MRLVYPMVTNNGMGNNFVTLAKAYRIAEVCGLKYQTPDWPPCEHVKPPTTQGYGYYFPLSKSEKILTKSIMLLEKAQKRLPFDIYPILNFDKESYLATGIEDVGEACYKFLENRGLNPLSSSLVVTTSGMWGGYTSIRKARNWVYQEFLSHTATKQRLDEIRSRTKDKLRICVQIRMGDFVPREQAGTITPGERVVRLPLEWYRNILREIIRHIDCHILLVTDGSKEELAELLNEFTMVDIIGEPYQDLLGTLMMADSDLVICSNSTYARMGVFLNNKPYVWPADTLYPDKTGKYGYLWRDRESLQENNHIDWDLTRRCYALAIDFTELPHGLIRYLTSKGTTPLEDVSDLIYNQSVPMFGV